MKPRLVLTRRCRASLSLTRTHSEQPEVHMKYRRTTCSYNFSRKMIRGKSGFPKIWGASDGFPSQRRKPLSGGKLLSLQPTQSRGLFEALTSFPTAYGPLFLHCTGHYSRECVIIVIKLWKYLEMKSFPILLSNFPVRNCNFVVNVASFDKMRFSRAKWTYRNVSCA